MDVLAGELQDRDFGIVVLTKENVASPWINFEAGALGKSLGVGKVAPLLLDITRADVVGPISQFQSTILRDRTDMRQFIRDIASYLPPIPEASLDALFEAKWPELLEVLNSASGIENPKTSRSSESILEEVLDRVRGIEQGLGREPGLNSAHIVGRSDFTRFWARNRSASEGEDALREIFLYLSRALTPSSPSEIREQNLFKAMTLLKFLDPKERAEISPHIELALRSIRGDIGQRQPTPDEEGDDLAEQRAMAQSIVPEHEG